jgi:integrase
MTQVSRTRALDSKGKPVPGLYRRGTTWIAGYKLDGKWSMRNLDAKDLSAARRERASLLAGLQEGRIASRSDLSFDEVFRDWQESRSTSERTAKHERHLRDRHLKAIVGRPIQSVTASEVASVIRMPGYSEWSRVAVFRIVKAVTGHAVVRGVLVRNPVDGLRLDEKPRQKNQRRIERLSPDAVTTLLDQAPTLRWKAALALAALAGLRLGEVRALRWADIDGDVIRVSRSALPDGSIKATKTEAGTRSVPLDPTLRAILLEWRLASKRSLDSDFVISTWNGHAVSETGVRKALATASTGIETTGRCSMHALRHSYASNLVLAGVPVTTVALVIGHANPATTLSIYARDQRSEAQVVAEVLGAVAR